jgi:hypothetical protein
VWFTQRKPDVHPVSEKPGPVQHDLVTWPGLWLTQYHSRQKLL